MTTEVVTPSVQSQLVAVRVIVSCAFWRRRTGAPWPQDFVVVVGATISMTVLVYRGAPVTMSVIVAMFSCFAGGVSTPTAATTATDCNTAPDCDTIPDCDTAPVCDAAPDCDMGVPAPVVSVVVVATIVFMFALVVSII